MIVTATWASNDQYEIWRTDPGLPTDSYHADNRIVPMASPLLKYVRRSEVLWTSRHHPHPTQSGAAGRTESAPVYANWTAKILVYLEVD